MTRLVNITGKTDYTPVCPQHPKVALQEETRVKRQGHALVGWRCPVCHCVWQEQDIFPSLK